MARYVQLHGIALHTHAESPQSTMVSGQQLAMSTRQPCVRALCVVVHGLNSNPDHMRFLSRNIEACDPSMDVHVARSVGGSTFRSAMGLNPCSGHMFAGIDEAGERLAEEISVIASQYSGTISVVGVSLGGLVARYAIAALFDRKTQRVAGLVPAHLVTLGTPHVGVRCLSVFGLQWLVGEFNAVGGRTGTQCFLTDNTERPLLLSMTTDDPLPFLSALASFQSRTCYANVCNDWLVAFPTAAITHHDLLKSNTRPPISTHFPHIVDDADAPDVDPDSSFWAKGDYHEFAIARMVRNLQELAWRRVSVRFNKVCSCLSAHNALPVIRPWLDSSGADVVRHVCAVLTQS
jgi:pimeloyl-ACP methyl ester carboxylesterase